MFIRIQSAEFKFNKLKEKAEKKKIWRSLEGDLSLEIWFFGEKGGILNSKAVGIGRQMEPNVKMKSRFIKDILLVLFILFALSIREIELLKLKFFVKNFSKTSLVTLDQKKWQKNKK
jgi:hypothetical protein